MLYHVSEELDIRRFEPRPAPDYPTPVVWAIRKDRLRNYLLPRDCPRVTFFADSNSSPRDIAQFLGTSHAVVAIESAWLDRVRRTRLACYEFPEDGFQLIDDCAGYYHSTRAVTPTSVKIIDDPLAALAARNIEIRMLPNLWALRDAIVASTLGYSLIRMRNAQPRQPPPENPRNP